MARVFQKKSRHLDKVIEEAHDSTAHGGQLVVDAVAKEFGLWEKLRRSSVLDHRKDKSRGFSPDAIVAQPGIENVAALRGHRIAVEQSATGAIVLGRALELAGRRAEANLAYGVAAGLAEDPAVRDFLLGRRVLATP
mgnify:CR=1 FL=1